MLEPILLEVGVSINKKMDTYIRVPVYYVFVVYPDWGTSPTDAWQFVFGSERASLDLSQLSLSLPESQCFMRGRSWFGDFRFFFRFLERGFSAWGRCQKTWTPVDTHAKHLSVRTRMGQREPLWLVAAACNRQKHFANDLCPLHAGFPTPPGSPPSLADKFLLLFQSSSARFGFLLLHRVLNGAWPSYSVSGYPQNGGSKGLLGGGPVNGGNSF